MAINKQTIISAFDDKLTLLQWLKTINKALDEAVLTGVEVRQKGNATFTFVVTFEDGTELESNRFVLAQGESINGATIRNGHLYLSLTNGDELDAGNLKPVTSFAINESQHLIVNYGDGTSQDLGAIFSGNVNVDGNFTANSIIENMTGYSFEVSSPSFATCHIDYASVVKNGNKITYAISGVINFSSFPSSNNVVLGTFTHPIEIGLKLFPSTINDVQNILSNKNISFSSSFTSFKDVPLICFKNGYTKIYFQLFNISSTLELNINYHFRIEETFLLSDNMAA